MILHRVSWCTMQCWYKNLSPGVDLVSLYPEWLTPFFLINLRQFYSEKYQDKFFTEPALWGKAYVVMEAVYHLPLSIWAIKALIEGMYHQKQNSTAYPNKVNQLRTWNKTRIDCLTRQCHGASASVSVGSADEHHYTHMPGRCMGLDWSNTGAKDTAHRTLRALHSIW